MNGVNLVKPSNGQSYLELKRSKVKVKIPRNYSAGYRLRSTRRDTTFASLLPLDFAWGRKMSAGPQSL